MAKFHVNSKGEPGQCSATKGKCPFGGEENHYQSDEEVYRAIAEEYSPVKLLKKNVYFDRSDKLVSKAEMAEEISLAENEGRFDDYFKLRKAYEAAENGTVEVTQEFINNAYSRPITLYTENENKTLDEVKAGYQALISSKDPSPYKEGEALFELISNEGTSDAIKDDFYENGPAAHKIALAEYMDSRPFYGDQTKVLLPQDAARFYLSTSEPKILSQAMYAPGLTVEQKYGLVKKYPGGYLDFANATDLRPIDTKTDLGKELYEASLKRIQDRSLDSGLRDGYYQMLGKDLKDSNEIGVAFAAYSVPDDSRYLYDVHSNVIKNAQTSDATRRAAIAETLALNATSPNSIIESLPKRYHTVMWPGDQETDHNRLVPAQRAAYENARTKLSSIIDYWQGSDSYEKEDMVARHSESLEALNLILQPDFKAGRKAAATNGSRAYKAFEKLSKKGDKTAIEEARKTAIAARELNKLYERVAPGISLFKALDQRLAPKEVN